VRKEFLPLSTHNSIEKEWIYDYYMQNHAIDQDRKVEDGLEFILNHFQEPIFPRKIMTKQLGYQLEVFNKQEALEQFKNSNYEDCRINAYPSFTEYDGINRTATSFLMVDLDLNDFKKGKSALERALNNTLQKIRESIGGNPTVLWTGNGYHVYQPVSGSILEEYETFYEFTRYVDKDLTSMFIQFAEEHFTDYAADRLHNPTVKSCLVRIPGSLNSKCVIKLQDAEVKIVQKWTGSRPPLQPMLTPFKTWLTQKRIDELKKTEKKDTKFQMTVSKNQERTNTIKWIEKGILEHPLSDHRKYVIWRILSPYLLNVKKLPKEEAYSVMKEWLDKCDKLEKLSFNPKIKIKDRLRGASKGYLPISMEKLKEENRQLYDIVLNRLGNSK
jgi:hypothetical protein